MTIVNAETRTAPIEGCTFEHIRSKGVYRVILKSWSVEQQCHAVVYISLSTGEIFNRALTAFRENFRPLADVQSRIEPRPSPFPIER